MYLELRLDPDDAARLPRLPALRSSSRARAQSVRLVWHDSPDGALAAQGLTLVQDRGSWRLERLIPGRDAWPPGSPAPVLEQVTDPRALEHPMPAPLAPVAAFSGRRTLHALRTEHGEVTLAVWRGALRAVTTEEPACRLHLTGEDAAVRNVALALGEVLRLQVPRATLAAEAFAAVRGTATPARRHGAPDMPEGLGVADSFAFVLGHLTDVILYLAPDVAADNEGPEPVHQMRVAVRRLRSAIVVFRHVLGCPELSAASMDLKALGARLGPTRDWDVFLGETAPQVSAAFTDEPRIAHLLRAAVRRRRDAHAALRAFLEGPDFRRLGVELAWLAAGRSWCKLAAEGEDAPSLGDFAAALLHRRLRKLLDAGDDIEALDAPGLHAVRLRAKRARYAAEIFAPLYSARLADRFLDRLVTLQNRLGVLNDQATAAKLLGELGGRHAFAAGLVLGFIGAGTTKLRPRVLRAWEKFRRTPTFWG